MWCCCTDEINNALKDSEFKTKHFSNPKAEKEARKKDAEILGFDGRYKESMFDYLQREKPTLLSHLGHLFLPLFKPSGSSGMLFVPNSDVHQVCYILLTDTETLKPMSTQEELYRACIRYLDSYRDQQQVKQKFAQDLAAKKGGSPSEYQKNMYHTKLREDGGFVVQYIPSEKTPLI